MVVYLESSLGLIQDGNTPDPSWIPRGVAIPLLTWVGQQHVFEGQNLDLDPSKGQALAWARISVVVVGGC